MNNPELERLLKLETKLSAHIDYFSHNDNQEYESLKSKLEQDLEKAKQYDYWIKEFERTIGTPYPENIIELFCIKEQQNKKLEDEVRQLKDLASELSNNLNFVSTKKEEYKSERDNLKEIVKLFVKWNENKIDDTTFAQRGYVILGERYNKISESILEGKA